MTAEALRAMARTKAGEALAHEEKARLHGGKPALANIHQRAAVALRAQSESLAARADRFEVRAQRAA